MAPAGHVAPHAIAHRGTGDSQAASAWVAAHRLRHKIGILDCVFAPIAARPRDPLYPFSTAHFQ